MKIFGAILDGIDGKLIEVDSDINPELSKAINILGARGIDIRRAREILLRVLPASLPKGLEAKGLITIDLIPGAGGSRGEAFALPIGIRAYLALLLQEVIEPPEPPSPGATDEEIQKYNEDLKRRNELISVRAEIMKHVENDHSEYLLVGGIRLDGRLYAPKEGLMGLITCAKDGMKVIVPSECAGYGYMAKEILKSEGNSIDVMVASTFNEVAQIISGTTIGKTVSDNDLYEMEPYKLPHGDYHDFSEIIGQRRAKYALEIAAAGGHNVLLWGPTREGKTTLANAIIGILPSIFERNSNETFSDLAEVNKIYSAKGLLGPNQYVKDRPFRCVSAKTGIPGLIGGGHDPRPGEISLAHCGALMIDEFNFMDTKTMEALRVPLESGYINITQASMTRRFPASFTLIATMNPCKCSDYGEYKCSECGKVVGDINDLCSEHPSVKTLHKCNCKPSEINPHQNFSGPILNRIDLKVQIFSVDPYSVEAERETTQEVKNRVKRAIRKQKERYKNHQNIRCNAEIKLKDRNIINIDASAKKAARTIYEKFNLNVGSYVRLHAVARTIADLKNRNTIIDNDIIEAHQIIGRDKDIFNVRREEIDLANVPTNDPRKIKRAIRLLAKRVSEETIARKLTLNHVAREAGISSAKLKSILEGRDSKFAGSAKALVRWLDRKSRR